MIIADQLADNWKQVGVKKGNKTYWVLAKPCNGPLLWRIKDAIRVLKGDCIAVRFLGQKS